MRILITNDDGILSVGLIELVKAVKDLGEIWVVAPASQCSAMSQGVSVFGSIELKFDKDFPVEGVNAYSISGTPADCVKVALSCIMPEKPDVVFSGINNGYNAGVDIMYSGTLGAAKEALVQGVPAIAFSGAMGSSLDVARENLHDIADDLLKRNIEPYAVWNVNFPDCPPSDVKGVLEDRNPAAKSYYFTYYESAEESAEDSSDGVALNICGHPCDYAGEGSDIKALLDGYISIGKIVAGELMNGVKD